MKHRSVRIAAAIIAVALLGGCSMVTDTLGSKYPSLHSERVKMASIVDGIKDSLPPEVIISVRENEGLLECGKGDILQGTGDGTQILAYRYIILTPNFDALAWMEEITVSYDEKPGWRVDREASGIDPDTFFNTFWSPENHDTSIRIDQGRMTVDGFSARDDAVGDPVQKFTLSSASSCAQKPDNWDAWGDFLRETPLPTPPPSPVSTPAS